MKELIHIHKVSYNVLQIFGRLGCWLPKSTGKKESHLWIERKRDGGLTMATI